MSSFREAHEAQLAGTSVTLDEHAVEGEAGLAVREIYAWWGSVAARVSSIEADFLIRAGASWGRRVVRVVITRHGLGWTWRVLRGDELLHYSAADDRDDALRGGARAARQYVRAGQLVPIEESVARGAA